MVMIMMRKLIVFLLRQRYLINIILILSHEICWPWSKETKSQQQHHNYYEFQMIWKLIKNSEKSVTSQKDGKTQFNSWHIFIHSFYYEKGETENKNFQLNTVIQGCNVSIDSSVIKIAFFILFAEMIKHSKFKQEKMKHHKN